MGTTRVARGSGAAPTTDFYMECDYVSQNQSGNYSTAYFWVKAVNRGGTGSYDNNQGGQVWEMDGVTYNGHWGTLPAGVGTNQDRWYDGPWGVNVYHDSEGFGINRGLHQKIEGWFSFYDAATLPAPPRIPKPPTAPGKPVASEILPQSMRLTWTASTDNKGSAIDHYLLRRYETIDGTGSYTDTTANNLSRVISGLTPGKTYSWRVYAHNGSAGGYSAASALLVVATMAPARIKVGGIYKYAVPYVKVSGVYKTAVPMVKRLGVYQMPV